MRISLLALVTTLALLGGCGESTEHKLQQAGIAMSAGNVDVALDLADQVLEVEATNATALMIKARSHLRLRQYEAAEKLFVKLVEKPELALDGHRELMLLAQTKMADLLNRSDFLENTAYLDQFTAAKQLGHEQADWLRQMADLPAESEYGRAQCIVIDIQRINAEIRAEKIRLKAAQDVDDPSNAALEEKRRLAESMALDAEHRLKSALEADPGYFLAASLLLKLQQSRGAWADIWSLAKQTATRQDLPATLAGELAGLVLATPDTVQPERQRRVLAEKLLDGVAEKERQSITWLCARSSLHLSQKETDQAYELAFEAFRQSPQDAKVRFTLSWVLHVQGKDDQARTILESLADQRRDADDVQALYGLVMYKLGEKVLAGEALRRAVELNPKNNSARAALIRLHTETQGSTAVVAEDIDKLYLQNPNDAMAIRFKLMAEMSKGVDGGINVGVENLLRQVEQITPRKQEHLQVLVDGYLGLRNATKAEGFAKSLVGEYADDVDNHLRLSRVYLLKNDLAGAKSVMVELKKRFPESIEVNISLAQLLLNQGAIDQAVQLAEQMVSQRPEDVDARLLLAQGLARLSLSEDALEQVQRVLEKNSADARALGLAARIHQMNGDAGRAKEYWDRIDETQLNEKDNAVTLALLKYTKGQMPEALDICRRAIAQGQNDPVIRLILIHIHNKSKNFGEEEEHLIAMVRDNPADYLPYSMLVQFYAKNNPERGILHFQNWRTTNDGMARLAQASLLNGMRRRPEALKVLEDGFERLLQKKDPLALAVARMMARTILQENIKGLPKAHQTLQRLVDADIRRNEAMLDQVTISWKVVDEATTLSRLEAIAELTAPGETRFAEALLNRFRLLNQPQVGLKHLDRWLRAEPSNVALLAIRGSHLMDMRRFGDAVEAFKAAIAIAPSQVNLYVRLGECHFAMGNYPAADAAFDAMGSIDTGARIQSLWAKGSLYMSVGLRRRAVEVYRQLEKAGRANDPRLCLALGQGLAMTERTGDARRMLALVPRHALEYPAAQMALVQLEQGDRDFESAKRRLEELARNPRTVVAAVNELVRLSVRQSDNDQLLAWSDKVLKLSDLPDKMKQEWLTIRIGIQAKAADWVSLEQTLANAAAAYPNAFEYKVARACVLAFLRKDSEARDLLAKIDPAASATVSNLAVGLSADVPLGPKTLPMTRVLHALSRNDLDSASAAANEFLPFNSTVYGSDLRDLVAYVKDKKIDVSKSSRACALAQAALESGLPALSERLCEPILAESPWFTIAHAIRTAALTRQGKSLDAAQKQITQSVPDSSLSAFVATTAEAGSKNVKGAIEACRRIAARDPNHVANRHRLSMFLRTDGKHDEAIEVLEKLAAEPSSLQPIALNDLAYRLAIHKPDRLEEAFKIATSARQRFPGMTALVETLGWIEHLRGNHVQAMQLIGAVLPSQNSSSEVQFHAASVYEAMGNIQWARYHFDECASRPGSHASLAKERLAKLPRG